MRRMWLRYSGKPGGVRSWYQALPIQVSGEWRIAFSDGSVWIFNGLEWCAEISPDQWNRSTMLPA